jgi:hypothetical protein
VCPTTFAKGGICFGEWFGWERVAKINVCTTQNTIHLAFDSVFERPNLKIWNATNGEICVPRNDEELLYWPILNKIWRMRQKFQKRAWTLGHLTGV